jgi:hypothetical protein
MNQKVNLINWTDYYRDQAGGNYNYFKDSQFQHGYDLGGLNVHQGYGLGGMFRKFASWVVPIIKKYAIPTFNSGANAVAREAVDSASRVAKDLISGVNFKDSINNRLSKSVDNLREKAESQLAGNGLKRKNKFKKCNHFKKTEKYSKKKKKDIFDL